jgi:ATP-dependent RNA helicase SUPV3L1/SUV3
MAYGGAKCAAQGSILGAQPLHWQVHRRSREGVAVRRNRVQFACIRELVMVEVGPSSEEQDPSAAPPEAHHDFSVVQGFQVVGAEDHGGESSADQAWRDALRLELEARAARLHQAVDAAIVLSNDGIIRWLGDPVARLSLGADVLNPSAVILVDESVPAAARETIKARIDLWIAATTRRVLAPLFSLETLQEASEIVRDLARELVRALGILEREPIKAKIKALAQDDRAELRKQGVRFGAHYIFVPALIKPAPRALALQLWALQAPGDAGELLRTLAPIASSGRTSLPLESGVSKEGYRVAGYRSCGERIVRVDVVERLAGIIRSALTDAPPSVTNERPNRSSKGFVVTGEMTSLTGCSGEPFASILRSMEFRPIEVKRSEFFASPSTNVALGQAEAPPPAPDSVGEAATDPVLASPEEPPTDGGPEELAPSLIPADQSETFSADAHAEPASPQAPASSGESAKNADMIVVWRPERRRPPFNRGEREGRQAKGAAPRLDIENRGPAPTPKRPPRAAMRPPGSANRTDSTRPDEKRRQRASDYGTPQLHPTTAPQHKAKVDPNSPFAKLLELRSLLEGQANKRP